ncbi:MAG: ABC transporter substrate-binding protein [Candidatus Saccharibacteria bacterium]
MDDNNRNDQTVSKTISPETNPDSVAQTPPVSGTSQAVVQHVGIRKNRKIVFFTATFLAVLAAGIVGLLIFPSSKSGESSKTNSVATKKAIDLIRIGDPASKLDAVYPELGDPIGYETDIAKQIFEPLVRFKEINTVEPALASSWKNDPKNENVWLFTIKDGVTFHNGTALTPESIKLCIEAAKKNDFLSYFLDSLDAVSVVGKNQVKITTTSPDPLLLNKLTNILIYDTTAKIQPSTENGTGPYNVKQGTKPTEKSLDLVAVQNWHGGTVGTRELQFTVDSEDELNTAIEKGTLDLIFKGKTIDNLDAKGLKEYKLPQLTTSYIFMNTLKKASPLTNKEVRRAIAGVIDKDALIKASGVPGVKTDQIVTKEIPGYLPDYKAPTVTIEEAKKILKDAGFTKAISLSAITVKENTAVNLIASDLAAQLAKIGINLTINPQEADTAITEYNTAKYDLGLFSYASDLIDLSDVVKSNFQKETATTLSYDNPTVNDAMKKVNGTFDSSKRLKSLQDVHKLLLDDVAVIPYRSPSESFYVKKNIDLKADNSGYLGINFWDTFQSQ